MSGADVPWTAEDTVKVPTVGGGVKKVSWKPGRNFCAYHRVETERAGVIVTRCGITVPHAQQCFSWSAMPVSDCCTKCWPPPEPEAA